MARFVTLAEGVFALEDSIHLGPGFKLPIRTTVIRDRSGGLTLISPLAIDDALANTIESCGRVEHLVAPNLLHHLFLPAAQKRWPEAKTYAPAQLAAKKPGLQIDVSLANAAPVDLQCVFVAGQPKVMEYVFFHAPSRSLVVTDLVFHILSPQGWLTGPILRAVGAHGKLAQSRALRLMTKDRAAALQSVQKILDLDFDRLIVAHGEVIESQAKARLRAALLR
jgi:hypothetical protein